MASLRYSIPTASSTVLLISGVALAGLYGIKLKRKIDNKNIVRYFMTSPRFFREKAKTIAVFPDC
jgi:hypothetical protein